jgi:hypothetical protein
VAKNHIIAKAALTAIGIYVISIILDGFNILRDALRLYFQWLVPRYSPSYLSWLLWRLNRLPYYLILLFFWVFAFLLLIRTDNWAHRLLGLKKLEIAHDFPQFAVSVCRITAVFCGVLLIYYAVPTITPLIRNRFEPEEMRYSGLTLANLTRFVLGFYLVYGAPHFVRWQVNKTLEYINQKANAAQMALREKGPEKE